MPYNGSGTFEPLSSPDFPAVAGEIIYATRFNNVINDLINNGLTKALVRDGQSTPTANLPMGGFKLTGLGAGSSDNDSVRVNQAPILRSTIGAVDWDNVTSYGVYEGTAAALAGPAANFPSTSRVGQLVVYPQGANIVQTYHTDITTWIRRRVGGTWTAWDFHGRLPDADSNFDLGASALRWANAYVEGVAFPATQVASADANTLDDYEEGTWTPTLTFDTPGNLNVAYSFNTGTYTKKGREITLHCSLAATTFTHTTAVGSLRVTGAPFAKSGSHEFGAAIWQIGGITMTNPDQITIGMDGGTSILFRFNNTTSGTSGGVDTTAAVTGVTKIIFFTIVYHI